MSSSANVLLLCGWHAQARTQGSRQGRVELVAALDCDDLALRPGSEQRQVTDQIDHLVPDRLVGPAQRLHRTVGREDERVVEAPAAPQAALPERLDLVQVRERSRAGDFLAI